MYDLQAVFDAYVTAYRSSDATDCAAVFLYHAEMYSPYGRPALGREAICKTHVQWLKEQAEGKVVTVRFADGDSDVAWCLAEYAEGDSTGRGTALSVLERQPDGALRIQVASFNTDMVFF